LPTERIIAPRPNQKVAGPGGLDISRYLAAIARVVMASTLGRCAAVSDGVPDLAVVSRTRL
jgi:hypothetical protein